MVLIGKISEDAIADNIKKRYNDDLIYVSLFQFNNSITIPIKYKYNINKHNK